MLFRSLVEEVDCDSQDEIWAGVERSRPEDVNISFVSMPIQDHYQGTNIQWVVFESTRVPPTVMKTMQVVAVADPKPVIEGTNP